MRNKTKEKLEKAILTVKANQKMAKSEKTEKSEKRLLNGLKYLLRESH